MQLLSFRLNYYIRYGKQLDFGRPREQNYLRRLKEYPSLFGTWISFRTLRMGINPNYQGFAESDGKQGPGQLFEEHGNILQRMEILVVFQQ